MSMETPNSFAALCLGFRKILTLLMLVIFFYTVVLCMQLPIDSGLELILPPSIMQKVRDGNNLKFLPPKRDGSDLSLPSELAGNSSTVVLKPTMGKHRKRMDAVFSVAEGIELKTLVLFVTTLRASGFLGDIVLSASPREQMAPGVYDFLKYHSYSGLVLYENVIEFEQNVREHTPTNDTKVYLKGLYGDSKTRQSLEDPRKNRHIGVAKFELYWVWSTHYDANIKILLIDASDTYFQIGGLNGIGSGLACPYKIEGYLHLYEENKALDIGGNINQTMITTAYSKEVFNIIKSYPVLIPSSTHGDQIAIETYLRAMVKQFDYTQCAGILCEWAFHNYLYYFGVLKGAPFIDHVIVLVQGSGSVNYLDEGDHMLEKAKVLGKAPVVYNIGFGDGFEESWAVRRYSRNTLLESEVDKLAEKTTFSLNYTDIEYTFNCSSTKNATKPHVIQPSMGSHRYDKDAIFAMGNDIELGTLALFVMSIRDTGYDGDIVLSMLRRNVMRDGVFDFLQSQVKTGLVVYEGLIATKGVNATTHLLHGKFHGKFVNRGWKVARFDLFWAWSQNYRVGNRILLLDAGDSYFQADPFTFEACPKKLELFFFEETHSKQSVTYMLKHMERRKFKPNKWNKTYPIELHLNTDEVIVLSPDAVFGSQYLIEKYLRDMVEMFNRMECYDNGCDVAVHNYIWYYKYASTAVGVSVAKYRINNGSYLMNSLSTSIVNDYTFLNHDSQSSAVVIHIKKAGGMWDLIERRKKDFLLT